jgi:cytochrome P450
MRGSGAPADFVEEFALPVPALVICELLGVPFEDREAFQRRAALLFDVSIPISEWDALVREDREYMATLVADSRRRPGDNLLGRLVVEHGSELTDHELVGIADPEASAGRERLNRRGHWFLISLDSDIARYIHGLCK